MEVDDFPAVDPNTDYEKILPIHQKRIIAFINHFITNTVSFLNTFAQSCESRLMEFEYKMRKMEASLLILESQLSSIPSLDNSLLENTKVDTTQQTVEHVPLDLPNVKQEVVEISEPEATSAAPKASQDPRFTKFFKMVQFGVPVAAVKNKMIIEGFDPCILDNPTEIVPGFVDTADQRSRSGSSSSDN